MHACMLICGEQNRIKIDTALSYCRGTGLVNSQMHGVLVPWMRINLFVSGRCQPSPFDRICVDQHASHIVRLVGRWRFLSCSLIRCPLFCLAKDAMLALAQEMCVMGILR